MVERALILVKPDGVDRALIGKILGRYENAGFKVVAMKMLKPTAAQAGEHYADDKVWLTTLGEKNIKSAAEKGIKVKESALEIGQRVRQTLIKSFTGIPIAAFVVEGTAANEVARKIAGATEPRKADPSSIRGVFSSDTYAAADAGKRPLMNLLHVSESKEAAEREIKIWFSEKEILNYKRPGDY